MTYQQVRTTSRRRTREREKHWSEGRVVVIRPDVPGDDFEPEDSVILRTDEERQAAEVALDKLYNLVQARQGEPPEWYEFLD